MRLVTTKIIDEWLKNKNEHDKIKFLEEIEQEIFDLFEIWEITDEDIKTLDFYIVNKAKEILKSK